MEPIIGPKRTVELVFYPERLPKGLPYVLHIRCSFKLTKAAAEAFSNAMKDGSSPFDNTDFFSATQNIKETIVRLRMIDPSSEKVFAVVKGRKVLVYEVLQKLEEERKDA